MHVVKISCCAHVYDYIHACLCVWVCTRGTCQCVVSDEAACFSQQPSVCAQETINKEGISWTIAARLAPCTAWELEEEEERRRDGWLEEDEDREEEGGMEYRERKGKEKMGQGDQRREQERGMGKV